MVTPSPDSAEPTGTEPSVFSLPEAGGEGDGASVFARLAEAFTVRAGPGEPLDRTLIDTFDARLGRGGGDLWLERGAERSALLWHRRGLRTPPVPLDPVLLDNGALPAFAEELPAGRLRDEVGALAAPRRLMPTVRLVGQRHGLDVLDGVRKTVARVVLEERVAHAPGRRQGRRLPPLLRVVPIRGYDDHRRVTRFLVEQLGLTPTADGDVAAALRSVGRQAGQDPCTPRPELTPEVPAEEAVRAVLKELLRIIRITEDGVDDARDIEFLHDFRVAVRQTRSILGQLREVLPERLVAHHRNEFRWLGQATGPARDLDVFISDWPALLADLGPELSDDLAPALAYLRRERDAARRRVRKALLSARYRRLVEGWALQLTRPVHGPALAEVSIDEVAARAIERAWRRVRRKGRRLDAEAPIADYHDLRIAAKKLRYLIALFGGVFDKRRTKQAVTVLKRLQTTLGDAHDAAQQADRLRAVAGALRDDRKADTATLLAIGRLIERIEGRGAALQAGSREAHEQFAHRRNRTLFTRR